MLKKLKYNFIILLLKKEKIDTYEHYYPFINYNAIEPSEFVERKLKEYFSELAIIERKIQYIKYKLKNL